MFTPRPSRSASRSWDHRWAASYWTFQGSFAPPRKEAGLIVFACTASFGKPLARVPKWTSRPGRWLGAALDAAAAEARLHDLSVVPWSSETLLSQDLAQAVVFGSGRPTILVPPSAYPAPLTHVAIAWDGSSVAARALWDALALLPENGRVTVLTIRDEKPLSGPDLASSLASLLENRGYNTAPVDVMLGKRTIAEALQEAALEAGAQILAMGGFGHSRLRDFILGGATQGILNDLRLPVLLSH